MAARLGAAAVLISPSAGGSVECPGAFDVKGYGKVQLIPTGWADGSFEPVDVSKGQLVAHMDARAYFADECTAGKYDNEQYMAYDLLGKTMRYTVDLSGAGCGCNAAFYLTSMRQNTRPSQCSDYYCDANNVCGESCAEIDIQEANMFAWHSTLHTATDHSGVGGGFGGGDSWNGPRDWGSSEYGPGGRCVDTKQPFDVAVSFPVDSQGSLAAMEVTLTQAGKSCPLSVRLGTYDGMAELSEAIKEGMTPIVSYWSANDMLWMDGPGADGQGPCQVDNMDACAKTVRFYGFSVADIGDAAPISTVKESAGNTPPPGVTAASGYGSDATTPAPSPAMAGPFASAAATIARSSSSGASGRGRSSCAKTQKFDCRDSGCCADPGMQCYEKNEWWATCKETCTPGSVDPEDGGDVKTPWSCVKIGSRTPASSGAAGSSGSSSSSAASSAAATATVSGGAEGTVILRVKASAGMPELAEGKEVTLRLGDHTLRATIVDDAASAALGGMVVERWDAAVQPASPAAHSAWSALAAAALAASGLLAAALLLARRRLTEDQPPFAELVATDDMEA